MQIFWIFIHSFFIFWLAAFSLFAVRSMREKRRSIFLSSGRSVSIFSISETASSARSVLSKVSASPDIAFVLSGSILSASLYSDSAPSYSLCFLSTSPSLCAWKILRVYDYCMPYNVACSLCFVALEKKIGVSVYCIKPARFCPERRFIFN